MFNKVSLPFLGFLQASGLSIYIISISFLLNSFSMIFGQKEEKFIGPIIMLLLFTFSAVLSASIVLGRSAYLFWEKKYKQSFTLIGWTLGWQLVYFILFVTIFAKS